MPDYDAFAAGIVGKRIASAIETFMTSLDRGQPDRDALDEAVEGIGGLSPAHVARADSAIGSAVSHRRRRHANGLVSRIFSRKPIDARDVPGSEWLLICSRNGRERQAALERLEGPLTSPFYCALLEWRCNDWVRQVRSVARETAGRCFAATDAQLVAETLFAVLATRKRWGRSSLEESPIYQSVSRDDVAQEVARTIGSAAAGPGTKILSLVLRFPTLDRHLDDLSRNAIQPGVRALSTKVMIDRETRWIDHYERQWIDKSMGHWCKAPVYRTREVQHSLNRKGLIQRALDDPSIAMRSAGLQALIDHMPESEFAMVTAEKFKDTHLAVLASRANYLLRRYAKA